MVALQVVPVRVCGDGVSVTTFALLDSGSQETFVRKSLIDKLKLNIGGHETLAISTMNGESTMDVSKVNFTVEAVSRPTRKLVVHGVAVETLNINTTRIKDLSKWSHLDGIEVPEVDIDDVTLLIGANVPEVQVHYESRMGRSGEPFAVRTILGWSIFGPTQAVQDNAQRMINVNYVDCEPAEPHLRQFLELDSLGITEKKGLSAEDRRGLKMLEDSTRQVNGRWEVGMLWKSDDPWLPDNKSTAVTRLESLRKKLSKNPQLHQKYTAFMQKLLAKGYARRLTEEEASVHTAKTWYLPHHSVFHPQKPDKVRVVFDAAAKHHDVSLNDQLLNGPDLTNSLLGVLLRFRERAIAFVGDIEGMFLQVQVPDEDTESLRFLWWENGDLNGPVKEFKMMRHIFGAKDSPSCCNYALKRTAEDSTGFSEGAMETVKRSFYVDDCLDCLDWVSSTIARIREVTEMLRENGGFRLTGWICTNREVLATVPEAERAEPTLNLDLDDLPVSRALGVVWDVQEDIFKFNVVPNDKPATKRGVLSTLSSLFDPIGFVSPVVLMAKNIMQGLWRQQIEWDDPLPSEERRRWESWKSELSSLAGVKIPRCHVSLQSEIQEVSLHNFSDASASGYGMCSYLRFVYASGEIRCSFLVGRSRCAPLKTASIPRLELQAATLAVRVYSTIADEITYSLAKVVFWSDSQTVLQYLANESKRFNVYVANRIAEIREVTSPEQWCHCPGEQNPADDASRGLSADSLNMEHRWWHGPDFLWMTEDNWPSTSVEPLSEDDPEIKRTAVHLVTQPDATGPDECGLVRLISRSESWNELVESVAWMMSMGKIGPIPEKVTSEELESAKKWIVQAVQAECFAAEIAQLKGGAHVKADSRIANLRPVLEDNVLKVGGRLENAPTLSADEKHPMILPNGHHVSKLVLQQAHRNLAHAGREQTLADTRKQFWILGGRRLAKRMVHECVECRKRNARPMQQVMAHLPGSRLTPYKPSFTFTGIDLFGPVLVKWGRGTSKRWGCLFTCLTTRAVFLEVVQSLSTDDFILVLRQFVSRRGPPEEIRCDNGSNFSGAERELKEALDEWNQQLIDQEMRQRGIRWLFQPPTAAHMSGVWERLVKLSKRHLKALAGDCLLTECGLRTLLAEAESIMNGRPLSPVSEDPRDLEPLTPNHFLMHRKVVGLPPGVFVKEDSLLRKEWKKVQYLLDVFWKRWLKEYIPSLQQLEKWRTERPNVKVGDMVLVVEENVKRGQWPVGRVTSVVKGSDDLVRSVFVKTATSELHRPITKLCMLEAAEETPTKNDDN